MPEPIVSYHSGLCSGGYPRRDHWILPTRVTVTIVLLLQSIPSIVFPWHPSAGPGRAITHITILENNEPNSIVTRSKNTH